MNMVTFSFIHFLQMEIFHSSWLNTTPMGVYACVCMCAYVHMCVIFFIQFSIGGHCRLAA